MSSPTVLGLAVVVFLLCYFSLDGVGAATLSAIAFSLCGVQFTDAGVTTWYGKSFISPSSANTGCSNVTSPTSIPIDVGASCSPCTGSTICSQSQLQSMLQYQQYGLNLQYTNIGIGSLGKENTSYVMTFYFAEYEATAAGQRVFNISVNGLTVATDVDVYAMTGGRYNALSVSVPVFSGARSNFDYYLPTSAGTASIANGIMWQLGTTLDMAAVPSMVSWGANIDLAFTATTLNPAVQNLTGNYSVILAGGDLPTDFSVPLYGGTVGGGAASTYQLNSSLLVTDCNGGTVNLTAYFNDPKELFGISKDTTSITVQPTCATTTPAPTTSAPPTTTTSAPTTTLTPTTTPAPTTTMPPTTTPAPTTTSAPPTTTPSPTSTTQPTTTPAPTTTLAPPTTTSAPPTTTPAQTTTAAPPATTTPAPSTTLPPPTIPEPTVTMTMEIDPPNPVAGGDTTISGEATSNDGNPPTGTVDILVDGAVIGKTPLVPVNGSATSFAEFVNTGNSAAWSTRQQAVSLQAIGRSIFSYTLTAPSTPGTHTIMAVAVAVGTVIPISAPVVSNFTVEKVAAVTLTFHGGSAVGTIGPAPRCKAPVMATAAVTGTNGSALLGGNVTLTLASTGHIRYTVNLGTAPVSEGQAVFTLNPVDHIVATLNTVEGIITKNGARYAQLLPGKYNATATYNGDGTYSPAQGQAALVVAHSCPLMSLALP